VSIVRGPSALKVNVPKNEPAFGCRPRKNCNANCRPGCLRYLLLVDLFDLVPIYGFIFRAAILQTIDLDPFIEKQF